jgi:DNA-binding XRE family transcriptional regulator
MTRADNTSFLVQANVRRHQATLAAAHDAIEQLGREGRAVSFGAVAQTAGVSRTWLYRQEKIRDLIGRLRAQGPPATALTAQRASADSLRQRLDTARTEITRLRTENDALRNQLARHLGLRRAEPDTHPADEPL